MKYIFCLIFILSIGCREVKEAPANSEADLDLQSFIVKPSPYVGDESLDVFLAHPWYSYDQANHIIWPVFQLYSLKTDGAYFKIQVIDYYDSTAAPGNYTIRIAREGETPYEVSLSAQGCGNVFTNPDYDSCTQDPNRNVYTYFDVSTGQSWIMSDFEASQNTEWDIAFNGTSGKINSGESGPGSTRIAPLYLYQGFFPNGAADFQRLAQISFGDKGREIFNLDLDLRNIPFSLPAGVERVVNEPDWLISENDGFSAKSSNWWIVKGSDGNSYTKFRVLKIEEEESGNDIESKITLEYAIQTKNSTSFSPLREWTLPLISSATRLIRWCLDFDTESVIECSESGHELRFSSLSRRGRRQWRFNVSLGAIGPIDNEQIIDWVSAPQD